MPPVRGSADATSASVSAPHSARTPPTIHTAIKALGDGNRFAIAAGERNIPDPMVVPTTTTRASRSPIRRGNESGKQTDLSARVPEQYGLFWTPTAFPHPLDHRAERFCRVGMVDEQCLGARGQALRLA